MHFPTWVIGPAIKVGEKVYGWLGNRFGIRVQAFVGFVGQGPLTKDAVIVQVFNSTDRAESVEGIYLGFSHAAGILYYTPGGPDFPFFPPLPQPCTRTAKVAFAFPLDHVTQHLAALRTQRANPKIEVDRVRVNLASGRTLWRPAKLGHLASTADAPTPD